MLTKNDYKIIYDALKAYSTDASKVDTNKYVRILKIMGYIDKVYIHPDIAKDSTEKKQSFIGRIKNLFVSNSISCTQVGGDNCTQIQNITQIGGDNCKQSIKLLSPRRKYVTPVIEIKPSNKNSVIESNYDDNE